MRKHAEQFHLHLADPDVRRAAADELWAFSGDVALPVTNETLLWGHDAADVLPRLEKLNAHITAAYEAGFKAAQEAKAKEIDEACQAVIESTNPDFQQMNLNCYDGQYAAERCGDTQMLLRSTPSEAILALAESLTPEENDQ